MDVGVMGVHKMQLIYQEQRQSAEENSLCATALTLEVLLIGLAYEALVMGVSHDRQGSTVSNCAKIAQSCADGWQQCMAITQAGDPWQCVVTECVSTKPAANNQEIECPAAMRSNTQ